MKIKVLKFVTGPIETNTYVVVDANGGFCLLFDPSSDCGRVIAHVKENHLSVEAVVLTHAHFDHIMGLPEVTAAFENVPVYCSAGDQPMLNDAAFNGSTFIGRPFVWTGKVRELKPGVQRIGRFDASVMVIPGHSPAGCAITIGDYCFCGDLLFAGSIGRSDFPGGDGDALVSGIKERLWTLPDDTVVCPGHGGRTTIGREKRTNPFLT